MTEIEQVCSKLYNWLCIKKQGHSKGAPTNNQWRIKNFLIGKRFFGNHQYRIKIGVK